jgi:hypothetical protein
VVDDWETDQFARPGAAFRTGGSPRGAQNGQPMNEARPLIVFTEVAEGEMLPTLTICASAEDVARYGRAVGSDSRGNSISPTLLLAFAMAEMTAVMPLPPSTLHIGQELTLKRGVRVDEQLQARFVLRDRRQSASIILHRFDLTIVADEAIVAEGRIALQTG